MHGLETIAALNHGVLRGKAPRYVTTGFDPQKSILGDVVILKRTYVERDGRGKVTLRTVCTACGETFPTMLRRMARLFGGGDRRVEVRNVPRCKKCRHEPYKKKGFGDIDEYTVRPAPVNPEASAPAPAPTNPDYLVCGAPPPPRFDLPDACACQRWAAGGDDYYWDDGRGWRHTHAKCGPVADFEKGAGVAA